jgi:hypothetical protein
MSNKHGYVITFSTIHSRGIRVKLIPELIEEITLKLQKTSPSKEKEAVPERFPLLRSMQMALAFGIKNRTTSC